MKKSLIKNCAILTLIVMVIAGIPASAASAPTFDSTKAVLMVGESLTYGTKNTSGYSVNFKIGNSKVATIKASKGSKEVKVTGVSAGTTTLKALFTNNKTKKVTTKKLPVTITSSPDFKSEEVRLLTGETKTYSTACNSNYSVSFKISDTKIASIKYSKGSKRVKVTGKSSGDTILKASFTNKKTKKVTTRSIPVIIASTPVFKSKEAVMMVGQSKKYNTINTSGYQTEFEIADSKVASIQTTAGETSVLVTGISAGTTTLKATFTNNKTDEVLTKSIPVRIEAKTVVKSLAITPLSIEANKATEINVVLYDEMGKEMKTYNLDTCKEDSKLEFSIQTSNGVVNGKDLVLNQEGATAIAKAVYHTGVLDKDGKEKTIVTEATIIAVKSNIENPSYNGNGYPQEVSPFTLSETSITLSRKAQLCDYREIYAFVRDRNTNKIVSSGAITVEVVSKPSEVPEVSEDMGFYAIGRDSVHFYASNITAGTYVYEISRGGYSENVTVTIKDVPSEGEITYGLVSSAHVDMSFYGNDVNYKFIVGKFKGGVFTEIVTGSAIQFQIKHNDFGIKGDEQTCLPSGSGEYEFGLASYQELSQKVNKGLTGQYTIEAVYKDENGTEHSMQSQFSVSDAQSDIAIVTVEIPETTVASGSAIDSLPAFFEDSNYVNFVQDGINRQITSGYYTLNDVKAAADGKSAFVGSITVWCATVIGNDVYYIPYEGSVNKNITYKN